MRLANSTRSSGARLSSPTANHAGRVTSVADAKANLTALLREVEQHRVEITVLRRGKAVAKISPIEMLEPVSGFGWMRGSAQETGDIVGPTGETWELSDEEVA